MSDRSRPLFVAGTPRSGTTWIARVLARAEGLTHVNEPDNEWPNPYTLKAKLTLGQYPVLREGDLAPRAYDRLWQRAFAGYRHSTVLRFVANRSKSGQGNMMELWRALCDHANPWVSPRLRFLTWIAWPQSRRPLPGRVMVKSVHAPLALEWIAARHRPQVLVVLRHPLNVIGSWKGFGWGGCALETNPVVRQRLAGRFTLPTLSEPSTPLQRISWEVGLFSTALHHGLERHPDWVVASHDTLCTDPPGGFRDLYEKLGLRWSSRAETFLEESNRPGGGFSTHRVASEQPDRWRKRLAPEELEEIWSVLSRFEAPWVEEVRRDLG